MGRKDFTSALPRVGRTLSIPDLLSPPSGSVWVIEGCASTVGWPKNTDTQRPKPRAPTRLAPFHFVGAFGGGPGE